jgi:hypothetical protein
MDVADVFLWFANESFLANQAAVPNANVAGVGALERAVRNGGYVRSLASPTSPIIDSHSR